MTDKYTEAAREMMEGTDYYETLDVIRQQDLVGRIASTLRSKDEEFDREVKELRDELVRETITLHSPNCEAQRFGSNRCLCTKEDADRVRVRAINAFDTRRALQLSRKEGKE